jgi:FlaA1/EpsC-like NDP-sugar epimerase
MMKDQNEFATKDYTALLPQFILLVACSTLAHAIFRTYNRLWRYAEYKEYLLLLLGGASGGTVYIVLNRFVMDSTIPLYYILSSQPCLSGSQS